MSPLFCLFYFVADGVEAGDTVSVLDARTVKDGRFVKVLPYHDDVENVKGDLIDTLLRFVRPTCRCVKVTACLPFSGAPMV